MPLTRRLGPAVACLVLGAALALLPSLARAQGTWSIDQDISGGDVNDTFTSLNNQRCAVVDDSNNLYIAFFDNRNKTLTDNNFEIYFRKFIYNFGSPAITQVTDAPNPSKYPSMATLNGALLGIDAARDSGRIYLAWQDARLFEIPGTFGVEPKSYTIFFRTYQSRGGDGFGPEIQVSPYDSLNAATAPVLAEDPFQQVWIVWQHGTGSGTSELDFAVYNARTQTFGPVQTLTNGGGQSSGQSVAATADGKIFVVWQDDRTGSPQIWTTTFDPAQGWLPEQQIVFSTGVATAPSIAADHQGHVHLVWVDNRDGQNEIYYKEYSPDTGWDPTDVRLTVNASSQTQPSVEADPMSNVYVVWTDLRNGSSNPDIYFRARDRSNWLSEMPLVYSATDPTNSIQRFPVIVHGGNLAYVAWSDERLTSSSGKNREVFYKVGTGVITDVPVQGVGRVTSLLGNYPNPFNPATEIEFELKHDAQVTLRVFDVQGRAVRTLVDSYLAAGRQHIGWDGKDDRGRGVPSGSYFIRFQGDGRIQSRTVSLVK